MHPEPAFRTDENGRPVLKASYIMRRDPRAKATYDALRRRGISAKDAENTVEEAFKRAFTEILLAEAYEEGPRGELARDRREVEIWLSLREGLSVDNIFPDLPPRHMPN